MTVNKLQTLLNDEYRRDIGHTMVEDDGVFLPIHDADGNQTLIKTKTGIWSVTYNGENRPVLWTCGTTNIVMKFDRMGRRVEYIEQDGLITNKHQKFVYDGYLCIQRLNGANNSITELFEWDPTEPVATRPMFMQYRVPGQTYALFYTHDGNKNVSEVVHFSRANGVAAHYEYAPFGETIVKDRQGGILAYDFADINPWRFSSEYADEVSGTVYYNYRHYEPMMGRWLSRDIFARCLYVVSENNPSTKTDYLGLLGVTTYTKARKMQRYKTQTEEVVCDWHYDAKRKACDCVVGSCRWESLDGVKEDDYVLVTLTNIYSSGLTADEIVSGIMNEIIEYAIDKVEGEIYDLLVEALTGRQPLNVPLLDEIMAIEKSEYKYYLINKIEYEGLYYLSHTTQRSYEDSRNLPKSNHIIVPSCLTIGQLETIGTEIGSPRWESNVGF